MHRAGWFRGITTIRVRPGRIYEIGHDVLEEDIPWQRGKQRGGDCHLFLGHTVYMNCGQGLGEKKRGFLLYFFSTTRPTRLWF